jgi:hypothetical protein
MLPHGRVESFLTRVTERRVTDVMDQGEGLDQIDIQSKLRRYSARNLRDFKRMSKPVAEVVGISSGENLSLGLKPPESARMNHAISITLKIVAVGMRWLRIAPPAGVLHLNGVGSKGLNHLIIESSDH